MLRNITLLKSASIIGPTTKIHRWYVVEGPTLVQQLNCWSLLSDQYVVPTSARQQCCQQLQPLYPTVYLSMSTLINIIQFTVKKKKRNTCRRFYIDEFLMSCVVRGPLVKIIHILYKKRTNNIHFGLKIFSFPNSYHWRIQRGRKGRSPPPLKKQKKPTNKPKINEERKQREREKRGSVSSSRIIIITCKSILIFLHHTFHKHLRQ